eukprot:jgi/Hompol1/3819/HPOL_003365-RA
METLQNVVFSAIAGLVSRTATFPLDTLKTRIQVASATAATAATATQHTQPAAFAGSTGSTGYTGYTGYTGFSGFSTRYIGYGGFRGLFRGLGITLALSVPGTAVYLAAYDELKRVLSISLATSQSSLLVHALAGAGAEAVSGLFWTPMEVLKTRLQTNVAVASATATATASATASASATATTAASTSELIVDIYRSHGIAGFYRGYLLSQAVFIPYTVVYFITYERLKLAWIRAFNPSPPPSLSSSSSENATNQDLPFRGYLICASLSGAFAGAVSNVLDVVKTRVQVSTDRPAISIIRDMWVNEGGPMAFTKGMLARIAWVTPSMAISVTVYEILKSMRNARTSSQAGQQST